MKYLLGCSGLLVFSFGCIDKEEDSSTEEASTEEASTEETSFVPTAGDWTLSATPGENDCEMPSETDDSTAVLTLTDGGFTFLVDKEASEDDGVPTFVCTTTGMDFTCETYAYSETEEGMTFSQSIDFSGSFSDENTMAGEASMTLIFGPEACSAALTLSAVAIQ